MAPKRGFSLIEVLVTSGILAFALCALLLIYINLFALGAVGRQLTLATNAAQGKLEELKNICFNDLGSYNGTIFDIPGFAASDAKGAIYISDVDEYSVLHDLKRVRIIVCFRQKGQRIVGSDKNLNGAADAGEAVNSRNELLSPVEIITMIYKVKDEIKCPEG